MHLLGISVVLAYFLTTNLASDEISHTDYYDYYEEEHGDEPDSPPEPDIEQKLRSASSVHDIMRLVYPSYLTTLKCRSATTGGVAFNAQAAFSRVSGAQGPRTVRPLEEPAYAAAFFNMEVLKSIDSEWKKTMCMPRCGGCCQSEDRQCRNISSGFLSKTLFEITVPNTHGTKPVTISVANHTQCHCLSKMDVYKQAHSIIRRALPECPTANRTCPASQAWSGRLCRCVAKTTTWQQNRPPPPPPPPLRPAPQPVDIFQTDACGPDKELDADTCQCVCRRGAAAACGPNRHLDADTCECVCNARPSPACPAHHAFDRESCRCACHRQCPRHLPLHRASCTCQCNETHRGCFQRGRRFDRETCSCHRPPCQPDRPRCESGFFFSNMVCRCVPSFWRPQKTNKPAGRK